MCMAKFHFFLCIREKQVNWTKTGKPEKMKVFIKAGVTLLLKKANKS